MLSLQELCCRTIVRRTSVYAIDSLHLPPSVKSTLKSYALTTSQCGYNSLTQNSKSRNRCKTPTSNSRNSCAIAWLPACRRHSAERCLHLRRGDRRSINNRNLLYLLYTPKLTHTYTHTLTQIHIHTHTLAHRHIHTHHTHPRNHKNTNLSSALIFINVWERRAKVIFLHPIHIHIHIYTTYTSYTYTTTTTTYTYCIHIIYIFFILYHTLCLILSNYNVVNIIIIITILLYLNTSNI